MTIKHFDKSEKRNKIEKKRNGKEMEKDRLENERIVMFDNLNRKGQWMSPVMCIFSFKVFASSHKTAHECHEFRPVRLFLFKAFIYDPHNISQIFEHVRNETQNALMTKLCEYVCEMIMEQFFLIFLLCQRANKLKKQN